MGEQRVVFPGNQEFVARGRVEAEKVFLLKEVREEIARLGNAESKSRSEPPTHKGNFRGQACDQAESDRVMVKLVRRLVQHRVDSYASFFICTSFIIGALAGVFVTARWWGWLLAALVVLALLLAAFEANNAWLHAQLDEVAK